MSETQATGDEVRDLVIDDHNYDGIQEYDNPLPKWWTWIFVGSFVFAVGYVVHYVVGNGEGVHEDYQAEMKDFERAEEKRLAAMGDVSEDMLAQMAANSTSIAKGKATYEQVCKQCHGEQGEGKIGPNLTDRAWIHGDGSLMAIYKTIANGVLDKGMPAWKKQLSPGDLRSAVAYVGSIRNTNVPGKEPQGVVPGKGPEGGTPSQNDAEAPAPEPGTVPTGDGSADPKDRQGSDL